MPSDLYAERVRIVSGSSAWTISTMTGSDPNGIASEPTGSLLRTPDGGLWINSNGGTEWQRLGAGVVTGSYTAAGTEGSQITVTLPVSFASNQYKVFITNVSGSSVSAYQVPENERTTTNFKVNSSAPFAANDKLDYLAVSGSIYAGAGSSGGSGASTFSGASVYKGSDQSISTATSTVVSWDNEDYDTDSYHDNVTNNSRFTVPTTGYYQIRCQVGWDVGNATGIRQLVVTREGTSVAVNNVTVSNNANNVHHEVVLTLYMTGSSYVQIFAYQNSGVALSLKGYSYAKYQIHRIGT